MKEYVSGKEALRRTAEFFNVSENEVNKEIKAAMDYAMGSTDPEAVKFWKSIMTPNIELTPENFIDILRDLTEQEAEQKNNSTAAKGSRI